MLENIDYWREAPVWNPETIADATKDWFQYLSSEKRHEWPSAKIRDINELSAGLPALRKGRVVVHCHGVFDLMHIGHIRHFTGGEEGSATSWSSRSPRTGS